jgi:hypothetical protein
MQEDRLNLSAPWSEVREQLKENDIRLSDQDLDYVPGREDELFVRIQNKIGKSKEEIRMLIESISSNEGKAG